MNDEQFEHLMKDAAESYNRPPAAPMDQMWASIESEAFGAKRRPTRGIASTSAASIAAHGISTSPGFSAIIPPRRTRRGTA